MHSKRSAQIDDIAGPDASVPGPQRRRPPRPGREAHEPVGDLVRRWQAELTEAGFDADAAATRRSTTPAGPAAPPVADRLDDELADVLDDLLDPDGRLAEPQGVRPSRRDRGRRPAAARPARRGAGPRPSTR